MAVQASFSGTRYHEQSADQVSLKDLDWPIYYLGAFSQRHTRRIDRVLASLHTYYIRLIVFEFYEIFSTVYGQRRLRNALGSTSPVYEGLREVLLAPCLRALRARLQDE